MARTIEAMVVMHYDADGDMTVHIADPLGRIAVVTVDHRSPDDLSYEHLHRDDPATVLALAPRPWGSCNDDKHAQAEARYHFAINGLTPIDGSK